MATPPSSPSGPDHQSHFDSVNPTPPTLWRQEASPALQSENEAHTTDDQAGLSSLAPQTTPALSAGVELPVFPGYVVLERLGRGGMGDVFKARHRQLDRLVALKVIRPDRLVQPQMVERFRQEARAVARLSHPNVVAVYDAAEYQGMHYLVLEYVEGTDLARLLRERGPLPIAEACELIRQAALGLQAAHEQGLVHRDIKPHNLILLSPSSEVGSSTSIPPQLKILDFGLARIASASSSDDCLTGIGMVMGTVDYMAPEQACDAHSADTRADIYSLGCSLYQLLTGTVPFPQKSTTAKLAGHLQGNPTPPTRLRPEIPAELEAILQKMMAREPIQRYQSPAEAAADLERFVQGRTPLRLNRRQLLLGTGCFVASGSALLAGYLLWPRTKDLPSREVRLPDSPIVPPSTEPTAKQELEPVITPIPGNLRRVSLYRERYDNPEKDRTHETATQLWGHESGLKVSMMKEGQPGQGYMWSVGGDDSPDVELRFRIRLIGNVSLWFFFRTLGDEKSISHLGLAMASSSWRLTRWYKELNNNKWTESKREELVNQRIPDLYYANERWVDFRLVAVGKDIWLEANGHLILHAVDPYVPPRTFKPLPGQGFVFWPFSRDGKPIRLERTELRAWRLLKQEEKTAQPLEPLAELPPGTTRKLVYDEGSNYYSRPPQDWVNGTESHRWGSKGGLLFHEQQPSPGGIRWGGGFSFPVAADMEYRVPFRLTGSSMMEISFHSVRDPWNAAVYLVIYFPVGRPWTLYRRFKKSNGTVRQIDLATGKPEDVEWDEGRWTMFRAVVTGALVQIEINGRLVAAITEKELPSGELLPTELGSACYTHNTGKTGTTRVDRDFFRAWQLVKV